MKELKDIGILLLLTVGVIVIMALVSTFVRTKEWQEINNRDNSEFTRGNVPIIPDVPRDAIPPLDFPNYESPTDAIWLTDFDIVIGVVFKGDARAYPVKIMNWHEIVNDTIGDEDVAVTYCPLCNSSVVFDRHLGRRELSFGNTGALYESAMVMYDRQTESYWYHVNGEAIKGTLKGSKLTVLPSFVTTWSEWVSKYPDTKVLSLQTGHRRNYLSDPYRGYDAPNSPPAFPVSISDDSLPPKVPVVGVTIRGESKAYPIKRAQGTTITDEVGGETIEIVGNPTGTSAEVFVVNRKNREPAPVTTSYWFAWFAAHPDTDVYGL